MTSISFLTLVLLAAITTVFYHTTGDYKLLTSKQTISGLYNVNIYVVGQDIEPGNYKVCSGLAPINYRISNYSKQEVENYIKDGVAYLQPVIKEGHLKRLDCSQVELREGEVIEAENKDAGLVHYVLKENNN